MNALASTKRLFVLALIALLACAIVWCTYYVVVVRHRVTQPSSRDVAFHDVVLTREDGTPLNSTEFAEKPIIVATWATWCPSCGDMLQSLAKVKETYGDRVEILAVNRKEEKSTIDAYREAVHLPTTLTYVQDATDAYFKNIDGHAMPEILIYDTHGVVVEHSLEAMSPERIEQILTNLLPHS